MVEAITRMLPAARRTWGALVRIHDDDMKSLVALVFVVSAFVACRMPAQNDTWWHLRAGQDWWSGTSIFVDHYSFTRMGVEWLNREWLSQALFFKLVEFGGLPALTACLAACAVAAIATTFSTMDGPYKKRILLLMPLLAAAAPQWSLRPQVFSFLGLALTVWLIQSRRYRWLPLLFVLWANLHGGVIFGVVLAVVFSVSSCLNRESDAHSRLIASMAAVLATCLTPLGIHLWTTMPDAIARFRDLGITEYQPLALDSVGSIAFVVSVTLTAGLWLLHMPWRSLKVLTDPYVVSAAIISGGAVVSARNTAAATLLLVLAIDRLSRRFDRRFDASATAHPWVNRIGLIAATAVAVVITISEWTSGGGRRQWHPIGHSALAALDRCNGNLYNRFDDGGYLIWFRPARHVFIDSRGDPYDQALLLEHVHVERTGAFRNLFSRFDIRCALTVPDTPLSLALAESGWTQAYRDPNWVVLASDVRQR